MARILWYAGCLNSGMSSASTPSHANVPPDDDMFFECERCGAALVVNCAAAGMTLDCQKCGQPTVVPSIAESRETSESPGTQGDDLRRHLMENDSQRTEITGYINQLNIQLHRWQLRLLTLNNRNAELNGQISALDTPPPPDR